jgi:hypothetical protein
VLGQLYVGGCQEHKTYARTLIVKALKDLEKEAWKQLKPEGYTRDSQEIAVR